MTAWWDELCFIYSWYFKICCHIFLQLFILPICWMLHFLPAAEKSASVPKGWWFFILRWFLLTVLSSIWTWHGSSSGAICWMIPQFWELTYLRAEALLLPLLLGFILFIPPGFGKSSNVNQKEYYWCFCQSSVGSVAGEHSEMQRKKEDEGRY